MNRKLNLFTLYGLRVTFTPFVLVCYLGLAAIFAGIGLLTGASAAVAIPGGLIAALLHYVFSFTHHIGHAIAARSTGYPMAGVHYFGLLGTGWYPSDEGDLPARVHLRRAVGGPILSSIMSLVLLLLLLTVGRGTGGLVGWLLLAAFLINFIIYTLGPFAPGMGIIETDIDTIRKWLPRR